MKAYISDETTGHEPSIGSHDSPRPPLPLMEHNHWSILTIDEDGVVTDADWGYHSLEEAINAARPEPVVRDG